jgi:DNA polymerase-1
MSHPTAYLVDASPYIFRAHFSLPPSLRDSAGQQTGAAYGFATFLLKLIAEERPTELAVAFDRNLNGSFRNALYAPYKGKRAEPPAALVAQIPICQEIADSLGAATFIDDNFEADDLIATLATRLAAREHAVVVVTPDKDFAQLVDDRVTLYDFARQQRYAKDGVRASLGVWPEQVTDWLGLAGDSVDNIPGVPGVGKKTAAELLAAFPHLEDLYERLEELLRPPWRGGRTLRDRLVEHRDLAFLSRELAILVRTVPLGNVLRQLRYRGVDHAAAAALFTRLGFKGMAERVATPAD